MTCATATTRSVAGRVRRGFSYRGLLIALVLLVGLPALAFSLLPGKSGSDSGPMMHVVELGDFLHDITERGELESGSNVEIRCEVKNWTSAGTTIIEIVPEGTLVQPGDIVARLDSTNLDNERTRQLISVANSEAEVIKARTTYDNAVLAKEEYMEGQFRQLVNAVESEVFVSQENLRRAEEYLEYSKTLKKKGYITPSQLEADSFAAAKAAKDLESAQKKMEVLLDYTRRKMLKQLESDVETAEAKLKAQEHSYDLERTKLADIENQLEKCTIRAPAAGQVVYANQTNGWGGREVIIEAGCAVRERQEIIRLPDHTKMQVKGKINEANVAMVRVGMSASVRLDAFPNSEFEGVVQRVNEYPAPTSRYTSSVKEYETIIRILNPPAGARPGLTAEVRIHVEYIPDVVQVPVQTIFEHGDRHYCVVRGENGDWVASELKTGSSNDKFVVVREGLATGDAIVLNAGSVRSKLELPDLPPPERPRPPTFPLAGNPQAADRPRGGLAEDDALPPASAHGAKRDTRARKNGASVFTGSPAALFLRLDKNRDGKLALSELDDTQRARAATADANHDGFLDRQEWAAAVAKLQAPEADVPPQAAATKPPASAAKPSAPGPKSSGAGR